MLWASRPDLPLTSLLLPLLLLSHTTGQAIPPTVASPLIVNLTYPLVSTTVNVSDTAALIDATNLRQASEVVVSAS